LDNGSFLFVLDDSLVTPGAFDDGFKSKFDVLCKQHDAQYKTALASLLSPTKGQDPEPEGRSCSMACLRRIVC
jgi:hypothetical protein